MKPRYYITDENGLWLGDARTWMEALAKSAHGQLVVDRMARRGRINRWRKDDRNLAVAVDRVIA